MPKKDRTFSRKDVIRIINNNLNEDERNEVILYLCRGVKIETFDGKDIIVPVTVSGEAIEEVEFTQILIGGVKGLSEELISDVIDSLFSFLDR